MLDKQWLHFDFHPFHLHRIIMFLEINVSSKIKEKWVKLIMRGISRKVCKTNNARHFKFRVNSEFAEIARFNRFTSVNRAPTPQRVISMICAKLTEQIGNFQVRRFTFGSHHCRFVENSIQSEFCRLILRIETKTLVMPSVFLKLTLAWPRSQSSLS